MLSLTISNGTELILQYQQFFQLKICSAQYAIIQVE